MKRQSHPRRKAYTNDGAILNAIRTAFRMHPEWRPDRRFGERGGTCFCAVDILAAVNSKEVSNLCSTCQASATLVEEKRLLTRTQFTAIYMGWYSVYLRGEELLNSGT